jgi:hypothetical protein
LLLPVERGLLRAHFGELGTERREGL